MNARIDPAPSALTMQAAALANTPARRVAPAAASAHAATPAALQRSTSLTRPSVRVWQSSSESTGRGDRSKLREGDGSGTCDTRVGTPTLPREDVVATNHQVVVSLGLEPPGT